MRYRRSNSRYRQSTHTRRRSRYNWSSDPLIIFILFLGCGAFITGLAHQFWEVVGWQVATAGVAVLLGVIAGACMYPDVRRVLWQKHTLDSLKDCDGYDFEHYVAELMRLQGFYRVIRTKNSNDHGADILAYQRGARGESILWIVQVKRYTYLVDVRAVQDVVRAMPYYEGDRGMVVTNSYLDDEARQLAHQLGYTVIERDTLAEWIAKYKQWQPWWTRLARYCVQLMRNHAVPQ